jgi:uncharacterized protein (TIGR03435 family)
MAVRELRHGRKLTQVKMAETLGVTQDSSYAHGASVTVADNRIEVRKLPLWVVCRTLERYSDGQIIDVTGLTGAYSFAVDVTPEDYQAVINPACRSVRMWGTPRSGADALAGLSCECVRRAGP